MHNLKITTGMSPTLFNGVVNDIIDAKVELTIAVKNLTNAEKALEEAIEIGNKKPKTHEEAALMRCQISKAEQFIESAIDTAMYSSYSDICIKE